MIWQAYTNFPALHRGYFLYDVVSCLPIDLLAAGSAGGVLGQTGQWLRTNRLLHALRVVSVHGAAIGGLSRTKKILVYGLLWLFLAHLIACIWWGIGIADFNVRAAPPRQPTQPRLPCQTL